MRSLEEDDGPFLPRQRRKPALTVFRPSWREAEETEWLRGEARSRDGRDNSAGSRNRLNPDAGFDSEANELLSWIRHQRRARVRHEGDVVAGLQTCDERR